MKASYDKLSRIRMWRTMTMRHISFSICLVFLLALTPASQAESPWRSLARMVAPKPIATQADTNNPETYENGLMRLKNSSASAGENLQEGMLAPDQANGYPANISGLAVANSKSQSSIDLGLESDDQGDFLATDLFRRPEIRHLLGDSPRFIYDTAQRPDPMLVPWVRRSAIFNELSMQARDAMAVENYELAANLYHRIFDLNDPRFTEVARSKIEEIISKQSDLKVAETMAIAQVDQEDLVELPVWVIDNTTGVIIDSGSDVCLIGDYVLAEGSTLPNYPEVMIASIERKRVIYQIREQSFEVILENN